MSFEFKEKENIESHIFVVEKYS